MEEWRVGTGMNNEVGGVREKVTTSPFRVSCFRISISFTPLPKKRGGRGWERTSFVWQRKRKRKKKKRKKKEKKKNHVKYATIFLRRSNFETLKGNRLELMAFQ